MRCDDDRNQLCGSNRSEAGYRLQDPDDRVLLRLSEKIGLRLVLLLQQEVEMSVEPDRPRLDTAGELLLPRLSLTNPVDVLARNPQAARARASEAHQAQPRSAWPRYGLLILDCTRTTSRTSVM